MTRDEIGNVRMQKSLTAARFAAALVAFGANLAASQGAHAKPEAVSVELGYAAGSVVIVNSERKIYYVTGPGKAIRYGVAVGKASELWTGRTFVSDKKIDPRWIPIDGSDPVEGGASDNPLGHRAMYLDWSLLRIHGTPSRGSIGSAVSNGCVRMLNEDVIDLYDRVHLGAPVFAINTLADAGTFKTAKAADLIYVNPEVRLDEKGDEIDAAAEQRLREQALRQGALRSPNGVFQPTRRAETRPAAPPVKLQRAVSAPRPIYAPEYRSSLFRPYDFGTSTR